MRPQAGRRAQLSLALALALGAAPNPARLRAGQTVERALAAGETHLYELLLPPDNVLDVSVISRGVPLVLSLVDGQSRETLRGARLLLLSEGAPLRLELRHANYGGRAGRYALEAGPARPASEAERLRFRAALLLHSGRRRLEAGDPEGLRDAEQELGEAGRLYREAADAAGQSEASRAFGAVQERSGDVAAALRWHERAREQAAAASDPRLESEALAALAVLQSRVGRMAEALANLRSALSMARALGDAGLEAKVLVGLGRALAHGERGDEAISHLEEALTLLAGRADVRLEADAHNVLGGVYAQLGDGERALRHVQAAHDLFRRTGQRLPAAMSLNNLGLVLSTLLERHEEALVHLGRALALSIEAEHWAGQAATLDSMGQTALKLGRPREALGSLERALVLWRRLDDPRGLAVSSLNLGEALLELGRTAAAREAYRTAHAESRRAGRALNEVAALLGMARVAQADRDGREALERTKEAVSLIEGSRPAYTRAELRASYFAVVRPAYDLYIDLLQRAGDPAGAFRASERARARTLLDALAAADPGAPALPSPPDADPRDVQGRLEEGTVLIEYALGEPRSHAWVVTRESLRSETLARRRVLEASVRRVVDLITARNRVRQGADPGAVASADAALPGALIELSDRLLRPLSLPEAQRLIVVADGALHYVPFAALPLPGTGEPLVARREIVLLPSASVLPALRQGGSPSHGPGGVAVLADPVFRGADPRVKGAPRARPDPVMQMVLRSAEESGLAELPRLRFSRAEAEAIARLASRDARLFLDFAASRESVGSEEVGRARILHFATHGLLNSRNPELTGLVLSMVDEDGKPRDGFLRLRDVERLRLQAEVVVLSACQTALGKEVHGEGLLGLTRGFMLAGAPRVVASLWRVHDQGTAELMKRFYAALLGRGLAPAAALREAQRSLASNARWKTPYYWAAFTLYGDWS